MKHFYLVFILLFVILSSSKSEEHDGDSITAYHTNIVPVINGDTSDACWAAAKWHNINYVWIVPTNQTTAPSSAADFSGRFKVLWNKTTNLLYFIFEITDDVFVNGYVFGNKATNYPSYDVVEVFLDEDRSGGNHTFNNNALAYHITGGNSTAEFNALDIYGVSWSNYNIMNYSNHLPEFKRVYNGQHYYWEFSLMALKNTFVQAASGDNPSASKATLTVGKRMGMTAAYCDNDGLDENPMIRDHFIGSKYLASADQNSSYINASLFGSLILGDNVTTNVSTTQTDNSVKAWVDNSKQLNLKMDESWNSSNIQITDIFGRVISKHNSIYNTKIDLSNFKNGCYFIGIMKQNSKITKKIILEIL